MTKLLAERKYLRELLRSVGTQSGAKAVVLVGSWARNVGVLQVSDLDVLVVDGQVPAPTPPPQVQLLPATVADLRARVLAGDEFLQWSLRYGIPLAGKALWQALKSELLPIAKWPEPKAKIEQAKKRYMTGRELLEMGDFDAAQEEVRFALSHLARARLLSKRIFPLSRPELPSQLRAVGDSELAAALEVTIHASSLPYGRLKRILELVRRELERAGGGTTGG